MTTTSPAPRATGHTITAHARLRTAAVQRADGTTGTRIHTLRSEPPLLLRITGAATSDVFPECHGPQIHLVAGAAGPLAGDQLHLDIDVAAGTTLFLREVGSTLLLPGQHPDPSRTQTRIHVGPQATFTWEAQPIIAAQGCNHHNDIHITLDNDARLLLGETIVLGRHAEQPGDLQQRLRISYGDKPLYAQQLTIGTRAPGWAGPAITDAHQSLGSVLIVDTAIRLDNLTPAPAPDTAISSLPGPGLLITAVAPDALTLNQRLTTALHTALAN
ncbi:MAG: urease accessory protein UreD [Pseudonocardiaceae bacterium]